MRKKNNKIKAFFISHNCPLIKKKKLSPVSLTMGINLSWCFFGISIVLSNPSNDGNDKCPIHEGKKVFSQYLSAEFRKKKYYSFLMMKKFGTVITNERELKIVREGVIKQILKPLCWRVMAGRCQLKSPREISPKVFSSEGHPVPKRNSIVQQTLADIININD